MIQHLGIRCSAKFCLAFFAVGLLLAPAACLAEIPSEVQVYSSAIALEHSATSSVEPLVPSDFADRVSQPQVETPVSPSAAAQIAEPGTLGLMALAGLMGGAVAMRHRLG